MSAVKKETVNYVEAVLQGMNERDFAFTRKDRGDETILTLPMSADNAPGINVKLIIDVDGDCKLRSYLASNVPQAKWSAVLSTINHLNGKYRYICLNLDRDGDICAGYDFSLYADAESVFEQAMEKLFLYTEIADHCIPDIMQTLWAKTESASADNHQTIKANLFEEEEEEE